MSKTKKRGCRGSKSRKLNNRRRSKQSEAVIKSRCQALFQFLNSKQFLDLDCNWALEMQNELSNAFDILKYDIGKSIDSIIRNETNEIYLVEKIVDFVVQRNAKSEEYDLLYEVKWKGSDQTTLEPVYGLDRNSAVDIFWKGVLNKKTSGQLQKLA